MAKDSLSASDFVITLDAYAIISVGFQCSYVSQIIINFLRSCLSYFLIINKVQQHNFLFYFINKPLLKTPKYQLLQRFIAKNHHMTTLWFLHGLKIKAIHFSIYFSYIGKPQKIISIQKLSCQVVYEMLCYWRYKKNKRKESRQKKKNRKLKSKKTITKILMQLTHLC